MSRPENLEPTLVDEGEEEIARIREVRHRISEELGHDPYRMVAYYTELQKEHPEKLVRAPHSEATGKDRSDSFVRPQCPPRCHPDELAAAVRTIVRDELARPGLAQETAAAPPKKR